jgi:hypothetical protein
MHARKPTVEQNLAHTISLLSRTPAALNALLRDLPDEWTMHHQGENTWSPFQIVGHLIHADRTDWIPRAMWILEVGESQPFPPFDREGQNRAIAGKSLPTLLDEFADARSDSLQHLRALNLQPADLQRRGRHPSFGAVTLSQLLATWAVHDLTHLHQLSRVMAHQYRAAVGPWIAFLGVLRCTGHSA